MVFHRGVSFSPALGDSIFVVSQADLAQVYAPPDVECAEVGTIYQDRSLRAYIAIDDLLGKHFAVLGTTGCGKSCAVATMMRAIIDQHTEGHVLLLDLHSEYAAAFEDCAQILTHSNLKLPYWLLNFEELQEIIIDSGIDREEDKTILRDAVVFAKKTFHESEEVEARFSADSPVPYRMTELLRHLETTMGKLDKPTDSIPYFRLRDRINTLRADRRFDFMFHERLNIDDNMVEILSQLFRIPAEGRPITILDLSEVPSDILNVLISLVCRLTFDFALWSERDTPILLVCEEAHRYASQDVTTGFEPTKRALSKIVNEGRKHGVSVGIISQRPSEMALGILSQCNTIFAMRMSNTKDQEFVRGTLSESGLGLIDALPSLRTGEAIAVGEGVAVPVRLFFDLLPENQRPRSGTAAFSAAWKENNRGQDYVAEIVDRWRHQRH
jgi:DNA helicase HerA-like ATPase